MSILTLDKETYDVHIEPEAISLAPYQTLYKKDKTKDKRNFKKQVSFIYFYANAKSDYMHVTHLPSRADKIMNDLDMLTNGEAVISKDLFEAIEFYTSFRTITEELYFGASRAAGFVNDKLKMADQLLEQVDPKTGKALYTLKDITAAIQQIPKIMRDLKLAHKEVVQEQLTTEGKSKGSKDFNLFEDGFDLE